MRRTGVVVLALLLFGTPGSTQVSNRIITTVAGGGPDQVHISNTALSGGLFFDAAGNLWVFSSRVFMIDPAGIVSARAGSGYAYFDGDGGLGVEAGLNAYGAVLDGAGNLLIADGGVRIRRVIAATGLIETVAGTGVATWSIDGPGGNPADDLGDGGPAASASFQRAGSLAFDPSGNIVISDCYDDRIRRIDAATGIITTIVGTGFRGFNGDGIDAASANLYCPGEIQYDANGNLYISDGGNNRVRRVDAVTGLISTVAGNGLDNGSLGDGGPATSATVLTYGIRLDAAGNLFIVDNQRIRRVDASSGIITTVAGNGMQGGLTDGVAATSTTLDNPGGVAIDAGNNLFITDHGRIRRIDSSTGIINSISGDPGIIHGDGELATKVALGTDSVAFGPGGDLFVGTYLSVRRVDAGTGRLSTVAWCDSFWNCSFDDGGPDTQIEYLNATGLAFGPGGDLFIANGSTNLVLRMDAVTQAISVVAGNGNQGASGDGGLATQAAVGEPVALAFDAAGNLYIAQNGDWFVYNPAPLVRRVDATTGLITTVAGGGHVSSGNAEGSPATMVRFGDLGGVALDAAGNIYVSESFRRVWRVDAATGLLSTIAGTAAGVRNPAGLNVDADGGLLIADKLNNRVHRVDLSTGSVVIVAGNGQAGFRGDGGLSTEARLAQPIGVASLPNGDIAIADSGNSRVRLITCLAPGAPVFIHGVRLDVNNFPVLDFKDGNHASQATGYHIYRSSSAAIPPGSWPRVGFNVPDMDAGAPNMQWVDSSGDLSPSGIWYYNVTAYNSSCDAEGPF